MISDEWWDRFVHEYRRAGVDSLGASHWDTLIPIWFALPKLYPSSGVLGFHLPEVVLLEKNDLRWGWERWKPNLHLFWFGLFDPHASDIEGNHSEGLLKQKLTGCGQSLGWSIPRVWWCRWPWACFPGTLSCVRLGLGLGCLSPGSSISSYPAWWTFFSSDLRGGTYANRSVSKRLAGRILRARLH